MKGYDSSHLKSHLFTIERVKKAITRAEKLDANKGERWPKTTGTHVYKVVKNIIRFLKVNSGL